MIYVIYWLFFSSVSWIEVQISEAKDKKGFHRFLTAVSMFALVFLIGLRWKTGTDWYPYYDLFSWTYSRNFFEPDKYMDYGYVLFNNICYYISKDYSFLLVVHAVIFYIALFKSYKFFTPNIILCVFLYTAMFFGMVGSNRQLLAVAIGFLALTYYLKKNFKVALFLLLVAVSFHITALLMLLYTLFNRTFKYKYILAAFALAIVLGQSGLMESAFGFVGSASEGGEGKVEAYAGATGHGTQLSFIGILRRCIMVLLLFYFAPILRKRHQYFDLCLNAYLYTVAGFFLFISVPIMAGRGMLYFNILEPVLIIYLIQLLARYKSSLLGYCLVFILIVLFFFQAINLYPELFIPYKGIFINTNYFRYMY